MVYPLASNVQARLSQSEEELQWRGSPKDPPTSADVLRSVLVSLQQEPHCLSVGGSRANL